MRNRKNGHRGNVENFKKSKGVGKRANRANICPIADITAPPLAVHPVCCADTPLETSLYPHFFYEFVSFSVKEKNN
ncbi:MAG: hypothetical protein LBH25_14485, partial [Fibromonadaceae bacterium]|nr:hypothetical protein [Fibromonadaceae bacterium]